MTPEFKDELVNMSAIPERLAELDHFTLDKGDHDSFENGHCAMELVSYLAGENFSDSPLCTCPVLATFVRSWNDRLPDEERNELLRDLLPRLIGTRDKAKQERRAMMAADWLVRTHTVAWLRLAGLNKQADALSSLPEITSMAQVPSIKPAIEAARDDARAARAAAWDAAWGAAWAAALGAAWDAAGDAAWDTTWATLSDTRRELQQSARLLLIRMIEA